MKRYLGFILLLSMFGEAGYASADILSGATRWRVISEYCLSNCRSASPDPYRDVMGSSVTMTMDTFESKFTDTCERVAFTPARETRDEVMRKFSLIYGSAFVKKNAENLLAGPTVDTVTVTCVEQRIRYEIAFLFDVFDTSADVLVEDGKVLHLVRMVP